MGQKKRARGQVRANGTLENSERSKERTILAGLAKLLDLPPDEPSAAVLTRLADQLGCDVAEDGTLSVREDPDASDEADDPAQAVQVGP